MGIRGFYGLIISMVRQNVPKKITIHCNFVHLKSDVKFLKT